MNAFLKRRISSLYFCLLLTALLLPAFTFTLAGGSGSLKSRKAQLNQEFRQISLQMKAFYDEGNLDRVIRLYQERCCKEGKVKSPVKIPVETRSFKRVKKEIRADVYQSLVLSYMALDMPEIAEKYLKRLLVLRHDEGVDKYWLPIRKLAREKYHVAPRLTVGFKTGNNITSIKPLERYSILAPAYPGAGSYNKDYFFQFNRSRGRQVGFILEYRISKHFSINLQPTFIRMEFPYRNIFSREEGGVESVTLQYNHWQKLDYIECPIFLKYRFFKSRWMPYVQAGVLYGHLYNAFKALDVNIESTGSGISDKEEAIKEVGKLFKKNHAGLCLGAGIEYDTGRVRLAVELNYKHGLHNVVVGGEARYADKEMLYAYYDVFDDMKLRNWEIMVSIMLPIKYKAFRR